MPAFTREQFKRMMTAVDSNNLEELDTVILTQAVMSKTNLSKKDLCFKIACHFGLTEEVAKYLELRSYSEDILRIGLFESCKNGDINTLKLLIEKGHVDPNKNFDISACHADDIANPAMGFDLKKDKERQPEVFPLFYAALCGRIEIVRYLAGLKNININKTFRYDNSINYTVLLVAFHKDKKPEIAKILLENGANPLIECEEQPKAGHSDDNLLHYSFYTHMLAMIANEDVHNPLVKMYFEEWYPKNKHREHELNVEAARIAGKHYSPEPSSGSDSPASAGSREGSPPHHSPVLQRTPPDSPVASRNGSPPSSSMQSSDSASSGSTGSSPEKVSVQPASSYQFSIPSGNGDLVHEFHEALKKNRLQDARAIYDTGRVKPDCYCEPCKVNALHWIMTGHEYKDMDEFVLHHPKYPANINSINRLGETALHIKASWEWISRKGVLCIIEKYADKYPNLDIKDNNGNTPLHIIAMGGGKNSHEVVEELLKHGANAAITNNQGLTARELCARSCPKEDVKKKVLAVFDEQLNPYQKQNPSVQVPVAAPVRETTNSAAPIIYTGGNKAAMFSSQNSGTNANSLNVVPLSPPAAAQRADAKSIGSLYAPPPQASVELPKRVAKEEPAAPRVDTKKSLGDRVKNLFHIK